MPSGVQSAEEDLMAKSKRKAVRKTVKVKDLKASRGGVKGGLAAAHKVHNK